MTKPTRALEARYLPCRDETELRGRWQLVDGEVRGDATTQRIEWLLEHHLTRLADRPSTGGWVTLYLDPADGRHWERTFSESELHGAGPPRLRALSAAEVARGYPGMMATIDR